jgi:hypothetical protein
MFFVLEARSSRKFPDFQVWGQVNALEKLFHLPTLGPTLRINISGLIFLLVLWMDM